MAEPYLVRNHGLVVYRATQEHVSLVLRTLRIDAARWRDTVRGYAARCSATRMTPDARLEALAAAYAAATPADEAGLPHRDADACPACSAVTLVPAHARVRPGAADDSFVYCRCTECGHGTLLDGRVPLEAYASPEYYERQSSAGVGYDGYARERAYREEKGRRLLEEVRPHLSRPPTALLEVGSGFGYTRAAAQSQGLRTFGVDLNPSAADAARALYGMETYVGTVGDALASGAVRPEMWDVTLYNFVLEHVAEPDVELRDAATTLRRGGALVLVVPSMEAREIDVFGGCYRSFRTDHLHIFSRRSITRYVERAGLTIESITTTCNAHLLRGFLEDEELRALYERGAGPDMTVVARRT